jgi:ATP-dependent helicase HrpB
VLQAPTGAGKTTRVPPALLQSGLAGRGRILLVEPRRLAARAGARRMAEEGETRLGEEVGYQVRFERCLGPGTRILAVTPGILLRQLQDDPYLESTAAILFDEFHERGLESDLGLGMVRLLQQTVRSDMRVVIMSATLDTQAVATYLGCPVLSAEGRVHPVEIRYRPRSERVAWPDAVARAVEELLRETPGDVLVFLPGLYEIRRMARRLDALAQAYNLAVVPLYGDLPARQQDAALRRLRRRKVVLATNVAETSVTVEGITGVVDTGLARVLSFDPALGLDRLRVMPVSRASAEQRAGRAGRTQPGICIRIWSESAHLARPARTEPEVRRIDLAGAVLQLLAFGEAEVLRFPWLDLPTAAAVTQAQTLLHQLGATEEKGVTELGRAMARLPVHPRIGRLLVEGQRWGCAARAALAGALLSERDPFGQDDTGRAAALSASAGTISDVLDRVEVIEQAEGCTRPASQQLHGGALWFVLRARDQLSRLAHKEARSAGLPIQQPVAPDEGLLRALLAAFPDRLARRRASGSRRGVMVGGRGVCLTPSSRVMAPELFLCIDVDAGRTESLARLASAVERAWLPAESLTTATELAFDNDSERVVARRTLRYLDLVLEETALALPDEEEVGRVLAEAAANRPERVLPPDDSPAGRFRTRVRCLRAWMPELGLPALDATDVHELLTWLCQGRRSFDELRKAPWRDALQSRLTPAQFLAVEREAPERLLVPSGSRMVLHYEVGRPPVLAVRIQELFGLRQTPRIAVGRVAVLLHLLAPNHRPQQVTDDLASFWANTYPQVRRELRARYPRHAWPEDPWTAPAERRPARKRSS